ncbi:MAG TPA: extracellular solute-binding protein [Actinomycetota bacterium]|nr:extracellular solute-binding protein [Actinomycetota bacterium]
MTRRSLRLAAILLVLAACGSPPGSDREPARGLGAATRQTGRALERISRELDGLDPEARRARLIELAEEEGGTVNAYGSTNLDDMGALIDAFEDATGITVNYYRANSEDVLQRLVEEADAGFRGADLVNTNGPELTLLDREGLLAEVDTPVTADLPPEGDLGTWFWFYINTFTAAWNTDRVSAAEAPTSWEEVLSDHAGGLAFEAGDVDWFATLVKGYFMAEKGMREEEAVALFTDAAAGARAVDGHTLMAELLTAGEFDVAASAYLHRIVRLQRDGAPVTWEPAVEPLLVRPSGAAVHAAAEHPAAAMLLLEFLLTDAQPMLLDFDRQPVNETVEGGGLPPGVETIDVDVEAIVNEFDKWSDLYEQVIMATGGEVIED